MALSSKKRNLFYNHPRVRDPGCKTASRTAGQGSALRGRMSSSRARPRAPGSSHCRCVHAASAAPGRTFSLKGCRQAPRRTLPGRAVPWLEHGKSPLAIHWFVAWCSLLYDFLPAAYHLWLQPISTTMLLAKLPETSLRVTSSSSPCKGKGRCPPLVCSCWGGTGFCRCHVAPPAYPRSYC